jgi:UDP-glucose 4-epimerase
LEPVSKKGNSKKVIVTGGAGYIGSHTVLALAKAGYVPIIVDDLSNSDPYILEGLEKVLGKKQECYVLNCRNLEKFNKVAKDHKDIYGLIHFAAFKLVGESVLDPIKYYENNIDSNINITKFCLQNKIRSIVFSSSCTVYGQPEKLPVVETTPLKTPESPYGRTKQIGEFFFEDCIKAGLPLNVISLRYFNPIGADSSTEIGELPIGVPNNLVPFITQTAVGLRKSLTVFGDDYPTPDGSCIRDYIHISDLAQAHVAALDKLIEDNKMEPEVQHFNIGSGRGYSVLEVIRAFEKISGLKLSYKIGERREGDISKIFADPSKALKELGWRAELSLEEALEHAWKWQKRLPEIDIKKTG